MEAAVGALSIASAVAPLVKAAFGGGREMAPLHPGAAPSCVQYTGFWGWLLNNQMLEKYRIDAAVHHKEIAAWERRRVSNCMVLVCLMVVNLAAINVITNAPCSSGDRIILLLAWVLFLHGAGCMVQRLD